MLEAILRLEEEELRKKHSSTFYIFLLVGISFILILSTLIYLVCSNDYMRYKIHMRLGLQASERNKYEEAIEYYSKAINHKSTINAYLNRGMIYVLNKPDYQLANKDLMHAEQLLTENMPKEVKHHLYSLKLFSDYQLAKYNDCRIDLDNLMRIDSTKSSCFSMRGHLNLMDQIYNEALIDFEKSISMDEGKILYYPWTPSWGTYYSIPEYLTGTFSFIMMGQDWKSRNIYVQKAVALIELEKYNEAIKILNPILKEEHMFPFEYLLLAVCHYNLSDMAEAERMMLSAIRVNNEVVDMIINREGRITISPVLIETVQQLKKQYMK